MANVESISWARQAGPRISVARIAFLSANVAMWLAVLVGLKLVIG